jgi:hypothetical protein
MRTETVDGMWITVELTDGGSIAGELVFADSDTVVIDTRRGWSHHAIPAERVARVHATDRPES